MKQSKGHFSATFYDNLAYITMDFVASKGDSLSTEAWKEFEKDHSDYLRHGKSAWTITNIDYSFQEDVSDVYPQEVFCDSKVFMKKGFVFVNGYGLFKFKSLIKNITVGKDGYSTTQYNGIVKLPKGVRMCDGTKWHEVNFWFNEDQIFDTKEEAIKYLAR